MNSFDKLLTEISWLYEKGYPDFSIKEDREALYDYLLSIGFPHSAVIELSERFINEDDIVKNKESGNTYIVKKHNPETQDLIQKDASEDDIKKVKDGGEEEPEDEPKDEIDAKIKKQQKEKRT